MGIEVPLWPYCRFFEFPDPRLRTKAVRVGVAEVVSSSFQTLLDDMFETMLPPLVLAWRRLK